MSAALELVVDALAAHRLTRLATADEITEPLRALAVRTAYEIAGRAHEARYATPHSTWPERAMDDPNAPKLARLFVCRWCAGWWISLAIVRARRRHPQLWQPIAEAAALSSAAALVARLET